MPEKGVPVWHIDELVPEEEARISVGSHSVEYAGKAWDGIRVREMDDGRAVIFRLDDCVDRLFHSAESEDMVMTLSRDQVREAILELVRAAREVEKKDRYIRPGFWRPEKLGLHENDLSVHFSAFVEPFSYLEGVLNVGISKIRRLHPDTADMKAKVSQNYGNGRRASRDARNKRGFDEALQLDSVDGNVAEGPGTNIFLIKNGKLITPKEDHILPGFTRGTIMTIAKLELGISTEVRNILPEELLLADEMFFTGTAAEVKPIGSITINPNAVSPEGRHIIGDGTIGAITAQLSEFYLRIVHGDIEGLNGKEKYKKWLTFVE